MSRKFQSEITLTKSFQFLVYNMGVLLQRAALGEGISSVRELLSSM